MGLGATLPNRIPACRSKFATSRGAGSGPEYNQIVNISC